MSFPTHREMFQLDRPEAFLSVLARTDLQGAPDRWWEALIGSCWDCLEAAMVSFAADACLWGKVFVAVADSARRSENAGKLRMLQRKAVVQLNMVDLGCVDPDAACKELLENVFEEGLKPDTIRREIDDILSAERSTVSPARLTRVMEIRQFGRELARFRSKIADNRLHSELDVWECALRITGCI